jgi:hypothetical protein
VALAAAACALIKGLDELEIEDQMGWRVCILTIWVWSRFPKPLVESLIKGYGGLRVSIARLFSFFFFCVCLQGCVGVCVCVCKRFVVIGLQ